MKKNPSHHSGFTLIEMSIVLLVLSIVLGGILTVLTQQTNAKKNAELKQKLDIIQEALMAYRVTNNNLPCPADFTVAVTSSNFGGVATNAGVCTTNGTYTNGYRTNSPGNITANMSSGNVAAGMVPVRSLGLSDDYAFDPWGGRIMYGVDIRATGTNAFTTYPVTVFLGATATIGAITVRSPGGGVNIATNSIAYLISHGPNGHGAYQLNGTRKFAAITNANELENCDCTASENGTFDTEITARSIGATSATATADFDDTVRYFFRADFATATELQTESKF